MSNKKRTYEEFEKLLIDTSSDDTKEELRKVIQMLSDFMTGDQFEEFYQHCSEEINGY